MKIGNINIPNLILQNGIYYFKKQINGVRRKVSLRTSDPIEAMQIVKKYNDELVYNKLRNIQSYPKLEIQTKQENIKVQIDDKPTLIQAFNDYIRVCKQENQTTDRIKGKEKFKQMLINKCWDDIKHENILDYQEKIQKDHKPHTAYKVIGYLKGFINYCLDVGYIKHDDYIRIKWMKRPPRTGIQVKITNEDLRKIINYLVENNDINFLNFIITQLVTVSRKGEIEALKLEHLDFDNQEIRIFQNKVKEPKILSVPLHILNSLKQLAIINNNPNGYIFFQPKNKDFYASEFRKLKKALNLRKEYILPKLRHTAISFVADELGLLVAQQMAGHKSPKTTADNYYISDPKHTLKASESIANSLLAR